MTRDAIVIWTDMPDSKEWCKETFERLPDSADFYRTRLLVYFGTSPAAGDLRLGRSIDSTLTEDGLVTDVTKEHNTVALLSETERGQKPVLLLESLYAHSSGGAHIVIHTGNQRIRPQD